MEACKNDDGKYQQNSLIKCLKKKRFAQVKNSPTSLSIVQLPVPVPPSVQL